MNIMAAALRGPNVLVPAGTLSLPEAFGGPLQAEIPALHWDVTPVTVDSWQSYLGMADQIGGRFGSAIFNPDGSVHRVVRAPSLEVAHVESVRSLNDLRRVGLNGVFASNVTQLMPTVEEWKSRFSNLPDSGKLFLQGNHPAVFVKWLGVCRRNRFVIQGASGNFLKTSSA